MGVGRATEVGVGRCGLEGLRAKPGSLSSSNGSIVAMSKSQSSADNFCWLGVINPRCTARFNALAWASAVIILSAAHLGKTTAPPGRVCTAAEGQRATARAMAARRAASFTRPVGLTPKSGRSIARHCTRPAASMAWDRLMLP